MYEKFKEIYSYNPTTGLFTRIRDGGRADRRVGQIVGSLDTSVGYIRIGISGKVCLAHRLAWYYTYGYYPTKFIDHINRDKTDNRICNLREVNYSDNAKNMPLRSDNKHGTPGITFTKNKYWARIQSNGQTINLGRFKTLEEAVEVRKAAELKHNFHANHGKVM
jgi:hypothetical protein